MINFMANRRGFTEDDSKDCRSNINEDQEEDNGFRCYKEQTQELIMDSSSPTIDGGSGGVGDDADDSEVINFIRRSGGGESSDGLGLGSCTSGSGVMIEKEHMFDKAVTPSDVGKLNRLVIPKQHAEKYFPLDSSTNDKGLLLNFEDRYGKPWRFRYSYWNSSQSYVMTKGWSRFVKEKKLHAGDIVSFQRGVGELGKDRLFIDWRRRPDAPELQPPIPAFSLPNHLSFRTWNHPLFLPPQAREHVHLQQANAINGPQSHQINSGYSYGITNLYGSGSMIYLKSATTAGGGGGGGAPQQVGMVQVQRGGGVEGMPMPMTMTPMVFESVPVVQGKAAAKRLRLFGVNMECPISESDECDILSSTTIPHSTIAPQPSHLSSSSIPSLPLRPYNANEVLNKGKASMSLDFDI